jgi:hypothetical protein
MVILETVNNVDRVLKDERKPVVVIYELAANTINIRVSKKIITTEKI